MSWHIEGCTGSCLACLIEETVLKNYGTQGLDFLRRKVGAGGAAPGAYGGARPDEQWPYGAGGQRHSV